MLNGGYGKHVFAVEVSRCSGQERFAWQTLLAMGKPFTLLVKLSEWRLLR